MNKGQGLLEYVLILFLTAIVVIALIVAINALFGNGPDGSVICPFGIYQYRENDGKLELLIDGYWSEADRYSLIEKRCSFGE